MLTASLSGSSRTTSQMRLDCCQMLRHPAWVLEKRSGSVPHLLHRRRKACRRWRRPRPLSRRAHTCLRLPCRRPMAQALSLSRALLLPAPLCMLCSSSDAPRWRAYRIVRRHRRDRHGVGHHQCSILPLAIPSRCGDHDIILCHCCLSRFALCYIAVHQDIVSYHTHMDDLAVDRAWYRTWSFG